MCGLLPRPNRSNPIQHVSGSAQVGISGMRRRSTLRLRCCSSSPAHSRSCLRTWYGRSRGDYTGTRNTSLPWVDRATLEPILGVGRRRAQQILKPCVTHQVGSNGLADRSALIVRLRALAARDEAYYEQQRFIQSILFPALLLPYCYTVLPQVIWTTCPAWASASNPWCTSKQNHVPG